MIPFNSPTVQQDNSVLRNKAKAILLYGVEKEIEALHQLSGLKRLSEFLLFSGIYGAGVTFTLFQDSFSILSFIGVLFMGIALNSLGIFIHEGLHGLLAKNRYINHLLSFLCGLPLLISAKAYQVTHGNHHFEFGRKLDYGTYKQHFQNKYLVWLAYWAQLFGGAWIYVLCIPFLALKSASLTERIMIIAEYLMISALVGILIYHVSWESIFCYWIFPSFILLLLSNIRGLASHALGDIDDPYISSRTVESSPLIEILFLHENYHLEHHLFPQVPSYNLKKVHTLIWNRLPKALHSKSYLSFLVGFFKSAFTFNTEPHGLVYPAKQRHDDSA